MFISWIGRHGRSAELAADLGLDAHWFPRRGPLPLAYLRSAVATARLIRRERPSVVVVMLPPAPALLAVLLARPRGTRVVADLHTGAFLDPRWRWSLPWVLRGLRLSGSAALVTGHQLAERCRRAGVTAFVVHDPLRVPADGADASLAEARVVLVPFSYANDEPVSEVLAAAARMPDTRFELTGRAPAEVRGQAPANVTFTGFLTEADYAARMAAASLVLALTTRDLTMQRAGYEALQAGVPLVTSDFPVLREFFGPAARYAAPDRDDLVAVITAALADHHRLRRAASRRVDEVLDQQREALRVIEQWMDHPKEPAA